ICTQSLIFLADDKVTRAGSGLESQAISNGNSASHILDEAGFLEHCNRHIDRGAANSKHLGEVVLGERKRILANSVVRLEQPAGTSFFHTVETIAGAGVNHLAHECIEIPKHQPSNRW